MDCSIEYRNPKAGAFEAIKKEVGTNETLFSEYFSEVVGGMDGDQHYLPTKAFKEWFESKGYKIPLDFHSNGGRMKEIIKTYYRKNHPDGSKTVMDSSQNQIVAAFGYDSVITRNEGKALCVGMLNFIYRDAKFNRKNEPETDRKTFYKSKLENGIKVQIIKRATNGDRAKAAELLKKVNNNEVDIYSVLDSSNVQNANLLALYQELTSTTEDDNGKPHGENFADEIFVRSDIKFGSNETFGEDNELVDENEQAANDPTNETGDDTEFQELDFDTTIATYDHSGTVVNVMLHLGDKIKSYFNSLKRMNDANSQNGDNNGYDTDNAFGLPYYMNANECATIMYHDADYTNVGEMIRSVRRIAKSHPNFAAFSQFADDMENNPHFAYSVYATFGKIVISKIEVTEENGVLKANISNEKSNKRDALNIEFMNIVKTSVQINDHVEASKTANDIETRLNDKALDKVKFLQLKADLTKLIRSYYPTVQPAAINSFISNTTDKDGKVNERANLRLLLNKAKATIEECKKSVPLIEERNKNYDIAIAKNRYERKRARREKRLPNLINATAILADEAVTKELKNVAGDLADWLLPYSDVKIELNSTNALGNQSSDVVNNSMVSYIQNLMNNPNNVKDANGNFTPESPIVKFGKDKFGLEDERTQYKFSNILVENEAIGNFGMFRLINGKYVATPYATEILNAFLFNGATNFDNNDSRVYNQMDEVDYTITALGAYQNSIRGSRTNKQMYLANFFMRTPSDAPKNYIVTLPRYDITGLIKADGTIDHNHTVFKQFAMLFRQELLNGAVARGVIFDTIQTDITNADGTITAAGTVVSVDGKPSMDKRELYKIYHAEVDKSGNYILVKNGKPTGKAFTSDRFVVGDRNYGQEFIDSFVDFLYGAGEHTDVNKQLAVKTDAKGNVIDIVLNQDQRNGMITMLDNFIKAVSDTAQTRIEKSASKLSEKPSKKDVDDFAINYRLAYTNFADLFEGDSKFYKGSQDFLKRAKEVQASGVPYGIMDYLNVFDNDDRKEIANLKMFDGKLDFKIYNKFRGVTIQNTIMTSDAVKPCSLKMVDGRPQLEGGTVARRLATVFAKQGYSFKDGVKKANDIVAGYANTKVNDAQSYITVEEWARRIIARGQYEQYRELIDKILLGEKLSGEDIININQYVQVQKNFYYDLHYDKNTKTVAPRQIKNAEFVLVPQLIEGTELEQVFDLMNDLGIDQLNTEETSKAGKARVLKLWDNEGKLNEEYVEDFKARAKDYTELYDYNHLYTQQETPQHINATNKAAIQIMKKIVDNIDKGSKLYPVKEKFMNLYSELIRDSHTQLMDELNFELTDKGEFNKEKFNWDRMYEMFREEAERLGIDSNLIDYLTIDKLANPLMPNALNITANRIENIAQALFNSRITRQTLPGFHAAQVTNVGFRKTDKKLIDKFNKMSNKELLESQEFIDYCKAKDINIEELAKKKNNIGKIKDEFIHYIKLKDKGILTDGNLKYHQDENGKFVPYIEVMLPKANFGLQDYSDREAKRMLENCVDKDGIQANMIIGYRIPTEGKQSIAVMKVVGFTADEYGSTIVVPNDWVGQTGSDFDIDSVYGIQRNINLVKDETFGRSADNSVMKLEFEKSNARKIKQNDLIRCMLDILSADESMEEHFGRSNFDDIEKQLDWLKDPENKINIDIAAPKNPYDFFDQADYQNEVMSNARLKGLSVVRDTFCSICNTIKPTLNGYEVKIAYPKSKYSYVELADRFEKVEEKGDSYIVTHTMFGWSRDNKNIDGRILTSYSSQTTAHILDAVKAGMVPNVNDDTFMIYKTIIDLGSNYETAIRFMALPGVKYIADAINNNNSIYSTYGGKPIKQAIRAWAKECGIKTEKNGRPISFKKLMDEIGAAGIDLIYDDETDTFIGKAATVEPIDSELATRRLKGEDINASRPVERILVHHNFYEGMISPDDDAIFVFGSNPVGVNGRLDAYGPGKDSGGAAAFAQRHFGVEADEIMNNNFSKNGRAYGLVTVRHPGAKKSLSKEEIIENIKTLYDTARNHPDKTFKVAFTNTNAPSLNGYTGYQLADMFNEAGEIPENIAFSDAWRDAGYFDGEGRPKTVSDEHYFDLQTIIQYHNLSKIADAVNDMTRCTNPDKFGAKQSVYETYSVIADIGKALYKKSADVLIAPNGDTLLEAIYPGVKDAISTEANGDVKEIDFGKIMKEDRSAESAYKTLYSFLRYATIPSIVINSEVFDTQTDIFRRAILKLQKSFTNDKINMNGKTYKDVEKYLLSYLYQQIAFIRTPIVIDEKKGYWKVPKANDSEALELARIKAANRTPSVNFSVQDINNVTQEEIDKFALLTPAEKVRWIQQNYRNGLICKYLNTNLCNPIRKGAQTIEFVENNDDIENVYQAFNDTYYNSDPLLRMVAADLIKYAFVVEGYKMSKNAVCKVIQNKALMDVTTDNSDNKYGTSIANDLQTIIGNGEYVADDATIDTILTNYVRSAKPKEIKPIQLKDNTDFESVSIDGNSILKWTNTTEPKKFICIQYGFGKNAKNIYYKEYKGYYYPLNSLEKNEISEWSYVDSNNQYFSEQFYKDLVDGKIDRQTNLDKYKAPATNSSTGRVKLDLYSPVTNQHRNESDAFRIIRDNITKWFTTQDQKGMYIWAPVLSNYFKKNGEEAFVEVDDKLYDIKKIDPTRIYKLANSDTAVENMDASPALKAIITQLREVGSKGADIATDVNNGKIYAVTPVEEEWSSSGLQETTTSSMASRTFKGFENQASLDTVSSAAEAVSQGEKEGISSDEDTIKANMEKAFGIIAETLQKESADIIDNLKRFIKDETTGEVYSITSPEAIKLIRTNENERRRFLKAILDARAFINRYDMYNNLNVESEDPEIRQYLTSIQESIAKLQDPIVHEAEVIFGKEYLDKISDDPLIQSGVLSVLDGYTSTGTVEAWINDLQETTNPLIQIITKEVMANIREKEFIAKQAAIDFRNDIKKKFDEAKAKGTPIKWEHIVDESGRFIQSYNDKFEADYRNLVTNKNVAKHAMESITDKDSAAYNEAVEKYIRAKLEFDKWMLAHTYQPFSDSYYKEKIDLTENALKFNKDTFVEYIKLDLQKKDIRSHIVKGRLDEAWRDKLKEVNRKIANLTKEYDFDGEFFTEKSEEEKRKAKLLKQYTNGMAALNDKYFDSEENVGFRKELDKNLKIVEDYEEKGERSTYSKEDYNKANEWLSVNAKFEVKDDITDAVNKAYLILYNSKKGEEANPKFKQAILKHSARDRFGVVDASSFTPEELADIKEEELANSRRRVNGGYNDKILIRNEDPNNDVIYKQDFYMRMKSDGADNAQYWATVNEINSILSKVYQDGLKEVRTSDLSEEDLKKLEALYTELAKHKKHLGSTNGEAVASFIKTDVDFGIDQVRFDDEYNLAKSKGSEYARDWYLANTEPERDKNGKIIAGGNRVPNHFLYGTIKAKNEAKWIDKAKMDAIATLKKYVDRHPTQYWYDKKAEMRRKVNSGEITKAEYDKWLDDNTIFDPQTQSVVPIKCWMQNEVKTTTPGSWEAAFNQKHTKPKKEYVNSKYVKNATAAQNYKVGTGYDNNTSMNESEVDFRNWLQTYLLGMARTADSQEFFNKGYLPARAKEGEHDAKFWLKEAGQWIGVVEGATGRDTFDQDSDVSYENDFATPMPMIGLLQSKDLNIEDNPKPIRKEGETDADFEERVKKWQDTMTENEKKRRESHKNIIDNNWEDVIAEFIEKAGHYNAVQDNKNLLMYGLNMLKKIETIQPNLGFSNLHKSTRRSTKGKTVYESNIDTNLINQYVNWMRRLIYNQYRRPNKTWTKIASVLQSITSANFMMLNVRGGIANVTYGETQIWAEAFAGEYFNWTIMQEATNEYMCGIGSMMANMYKPTSTSKVDAVIKAMNVVDFDALVESGRQEYTFAEFEKKLRDAMYSPQTSGEHFMQNRALIAMAMSHRLVENKNPELNGRSKYILVNEREYLRELHEKALKEILNDEQYKKYEAYCERLLSDENTAKSVMWRRKDMTTEFVKRLPQDVKEKFIAKKKELEKQYKEDFKDDTKHPTLYSQLRLTDDGVMGFVPDSLMDKMNIKNEDGSIDAYKILGAFKGRVISVNKKIHGVYDKLGAAQLEKYWYGPLVMQYHKHIFPGLMKRWRRQGGFNEERGTVEKGSYIALWDFLATPIRKIKDTAGLTDAEVEAMEGVQNVLQSIVEFCRNIDTYWNILPNHEKANIRRCLGEVCGVLSALFLAIGVRCMMDDDDDNILLNLALYEADRLASESWQYNPWGAASEFKKLWSSPVAVQSIVGDVMNSAGTLAQMLIEGDEYDPYYHSGKYAGQHRLKVYVERRIPIYRGIKSILNIADDNHYYKLGDNMLSIIPVKDIAQYIRESF